MYTTSYHMRPARPHWQPSLLSPGSRLAKLLPNPGVSLPDKAREGQMLWSERAGLGTRMERRFQMWPISLWREGEDTVEICVIPRIDWGWGWGRGAKINHSKRFRPFHYVKVWEGHFLFFINDYRACKYIFPPFLIYSKALCLATVMARLWLHNCSRPGKAFKIHTPLTQIK